MAFGFGEYFVKVMEPGKPPNETRFATLPLAQSYANTVFIKTPIVRIFIMKGKSGIIESKSSAGYEKFVRTTSEEERSRLRKMERR